MWKGTEKEQQADWPGRESVRPWTRRATEKVQSEERACEKSTSDLWPLADIFLTYSTKLTEKKTKRQTSGWRLLAEQGRSSLLSSVKPSLGRAASLHIQFGVWFNLHQCYFVWLVTLLNCFFFFLICISQANALICFSKEFLSITRMRWLHYFITLLNSSGATAPINKPAW